MNKDLQVEMWNMQSVYRSKAMQNVIVVTQD